MITSNLLAAEETRSFRELAIADRLTSQRNRAYSNVAIAPQTPMELLEPTQLTGPSTAGRNLSILNSGLNMASGIAGAFAPASGDIGGGGGVGMNVPAPVTNLSTQWNDMSSYVANSPFGY